MTKPLTRRKALAALAAGAGVAASGPSGAAAETSDGTPRVAYHLADLNKAGFVLGNIRNHIDGMGGPEGVRIALVVHGPALAAFRDKGNTAIAWPVARLTREGVALYACIHTLEGMKLTLADLLPGFAVAEKGGVVKLAELQSQGWLYLRP